MCNKKERKRDRRWYLFPVSTLGAVYFAVHGGTGRGGGGSRRDGAGVFFPNRDGAVIYFFPRRDRAVVVFFRGGTGWLFFFFDGTGRGGGFFFFSRAGTGRLFLAVAMFLAGRGKIVTPSRQRRFKPSRQPSM